MAQFDVYRNRNAATKKLYPYLVDIQNPFLNDLATRIVIPLGDAKVFSGSVLKGLTPELRFEEEDLLLLTPQVSSISRKQLGNPVGSLAHFRENLLNALDFAISGI
ncbi:MAG: CcdB family protein [Gammaproteobacteria bacterium]